MLWGLGGEGKLMQCFVIQPFDDGGRYDKRYKDVFEPAIKNADLEPYRVDRDPSVSVLIDDIERGIEHSSVCLAEISTDNPNVWFELGYAIASQRDVVLVCSDERTTPFPFDEQHRKIIQYPTQSSSDFETARSKTTERLKAVLKRREKLGLLSSLSSVSRVEGLEQYEIAGLIAMAEEVDDPEAGIGSFFFHRNMRQAGFTKVAGILAMKSLLDRGMLERFETENYTAFRVTSKGMSWLLTNKERLTLQIAAVEPQGLTEEDIQGLTEEDVPF